MQLRRHRWWEGSIGGPLTKRASATTLTTAFSILFLGVCAMTAHNLLAPSV